MSANIRNTFIQIIFVIIIMAMLALIAKLTYINTTLAPKLKKLAKHQHQAYRPIPAIRGTIYDRRGRILAATKLVPSLFADPAIIEDKISAADILSALTNISPEKILSLLEKKPKSRFVWLARYINTDIAESIKKLPLRGIGIIYEPKRIYPAGTLAGHLLGTVNIDGKGIEGIELKFDKILAGIPGYETYIRDATGKKIWLIKNKCKQPINGKHLILTIDAVIQQFTQDILADTCRHYHAHSGSAIVMIPYTGEILALACYPQVDPNEFSKFPPTHRRNRAITDPFEPGSIFKPFIAAFALQAGVVKWNEKIFCHNGAYTIGRRILHDHHPYGELTFQEIIIHSSNIGMGIIGQRLGNSKLYQAVRTFGFGQKTGIELPGEDKGIVRPLRKWNDYSTTSIPMGQEIAATAIQLIHAFSGLANSGLILKPKLIRAYIDERGQITNENVEPEIQKQAIRPDIAKLMIKVLRQVVTEGTGKRAKLKGYQVFGKTGTAQIPRKNGRGYEPNAYVASFLGGAPAENPQIVAFVTVRHPDRKIGHFGGTVSAPAVKKILQAYFKYMNIGPFETEEKEEKIKITD